MKAKRSIQLKAVFLMVVFALNSVVGFACTLGIDMGFNSMHHHDEEATEAGIQVQAEGAKHHHHNEATKHHHDSREDAEKGGCCNDKVINFQNLDKNTNQNANLAINAPEFVTFLSNFFGIDIFKPSLVSSQKYIVRFFHPPPTDIRILIRSFQI